MILSCKAPLSSISQIVEFVAPVAVVPPPAQRCLWVACGGLERRLFLGRGWGDGKVCGRGWGSGRGAGGGNGLCVGVVRYRGVEVEGHVVEGGVPERSFVCYVGEEAEWQDVWVASWRCIHGVAA